jgi:hypothetical protein
MNRTGLGDRKALIRILGTLTPDYFAAGSRSVISVGFFE